MKKESGITMIALIVTIVVILILSGVSIKSAIDKDGIIKKVESEKNKIEQEIQYSESKRNQLLDEMKGEASYIPDRIDKTALENTVQIAKKVNTNEYDQNLLELNEFRIALQEAENVLKDTNATQQEVDLAEKKLSTAMQKLQANPKLDFTELDSLIRYAEGITLSDYNQAAAQIFYKSLTLVKSKRNGCSTQNQIDNLRDQLQQAINELYNSKNT